MLAGIIVDIVILLLLVIGGIWGWKSGVVEMLSKPIKFVLTIIISFSLATVVGSNIVQPIISAPVTNQVSSIVESKCEEIAEIADIEKLPTIVRLLAEANGIDTEAVFSQEGKEALIEEVVKTVTDPVVGIISVVIAYILLHLVSSIVLTLAFKIADNCIKNGVGVISKANSILGCVIMTLLGATIVWAICGISDFILNIPLLQGQAWVQSFTSNNAWFSGFLYRFFKGLSPIELLLSF